MQDFAKLFLTLIWFRIVSQSFNQNQREFYYINLVKDLYVTEIENEYVMDFSKLNMTIDLIQNQNV